MKDITAEHASFHELWGSAHFHKIVGRMPDYRFAVNLLLKACIIEYAIFRQIAG